MSPRLLGSVAAVSLLLLFALRIYALFASVHARTPWDDRYFRQAAIEATEEVSAPEALAGVLLPNSETVLGRTIGYHSWLVLSWGTLRAGGGSDPEIAFHVANVALLTLQLLAVYLLARWSLGSQVVAGTLAFVYFSAPVVFGINRWVVTDNHILTALLVGSLVACWLTAQPAPSDRGLAKSFSSRPKMILLALIGGYAMAVFSTVREYAVPIFLPLILAGFVGLWLRKQRLAAVAYAAVLTPYLIALISPFRVALEEFSAKSGALSYFHPMSEMIPHLWWHALGPVLSTLLFVGTAVALWTGAPRAGTWNSDGSRSRGSLGLVLLLAAYIGLTITYVVGLSMSYVRVVRPTLLPMVTVICGLLVAARALPRTRRAFTGAPARTILLVAISAAWLVQGYQLLYAFEGGGSYLFGSHDLEVWNHPLHLRPLEDPDDSHVPQTKCEVARRQAAKTALREDLHRELSRLRYTPDPKGRRKVALSIADDPRSDGRFLDGENTTVFGTAWDMWTYGTQPAGVVVRNPSDQPIEPVIRLATWAAMDNYPIRVSWEDGDDISHYQFTRRQVHSVILAPVPSRSKRLYIIWSEKAWQSEDERTLGVQIHAAE